ncbi:MAG: EAL domain-containing protein [Actinomycetota bacterium]
MGRAHDNESNEAAVIDAVVASSQWMSRLATEVEAAAAVLETCEADDFEATLEVVLAKVAVLFGVAAIGECNGDPSLGVKWFDPAATDLDEMIDMIPLLECGVGAGGPYSIMAPSGRPGMAIPSPPGSFSHHLAILAGAPEGFSAEETSMLGLFAATVSAARRRVEATRALEDRLEDQAFLNNISAMAAIDSPDALQLVLATVADRFGLVSATTWEFLDGRLWLVESSSADGDRQVDADVSVPARTSDLASLVSAGHARLPVRETPAASISPFAGHLPTLVVPLVGPAGAEGVVAFIDPRAMDVTTATSIGRSVQKMLARRHVIDVGERRAATEQFLRELASAIGEASHEREPELLDHVFSELNRHFDLRGSSLWLHVGEGVYFESRRGRWADGTPYGEALSVPLGAMVEPRLGQDGYELLDHRRLEALFGTSVPDSSALVVPVAGSGRADGLLVLVGRPRSRWDDAVVTACQTLGMIVGQGLARFGAEREVARRLELTQLSHRVAGMAVDARVGTVRDTLVNILQSCVDFFGLAEGQIWRLENDSLLLRAAVRADGTDIPTGPPIPLDVPDAIGHRGWSVAGLDAVAGLYEAGLRDPASSLVLSMPYSAGSEPLGFLLFVDPHARWWSDDEINAIRAIADTVGQLRSRMLVTRALDRQQTTEQLLNEAASTFLDATVDTLRDVVDDALESLRSHLGCDSVAVFELDPKTLEIVCPCEATVDGQPLQADFAPMRRDDPVIIRILDPDHGPEWQLTDLIGLPEGSDRTSMVVVPSVRGRDLLILSAANRHGVPFAPRATGAVQALTGMLAQLRSRILLERSTLLRSEVDRALGEIAADFVERSTDDVGAAIDRATARVGALFDLGCVSLWVSDQAGGLWRAFRWQAESMSAVDTVDQLDAGHPILNMVRSEASSMIQPGPESHDPSVIGLTCGFAPIADGNDLIGMWSITDPRPLHLVGHAKIVKDMLESLAQLVRQLWRRLDADTAIGRRLESEDLLRQFATMLATSPTGEPASATEAFGWLIQQLGIDHASLWHDHELPSVTELHLQVATDPALRIDASADRVVLGADTDVVSAVDDADNGWPAGADHPLVSPLREMLGLEGDRRVRWISDRHGWRLFIVKADAEAFAPHVVAAMTTALSVLTQHQGRAAAERALSTAFSSAPIAICIRDRETKLLSCNQAYLDLAGRPEDELIGSGLDLVISPEHLHEALDDLSSLDLGGQTVRELAYRRHDGSVVWARVRTTPVEVPGQPEPVFYMYSEDITESRRSRQLLEYQATHDELTGLPNRRSFVGHVATELDHGLDFAVLILDLDRFKLVNDSMGHSAGDQLLITCADRIRLSLRPGDLVCRLGGDEFAILLRAPADAAAAAVVADRLLRLLSEPVRIDDEEVFPSASIGVAIPEPGDGVDELMRHADAAMYEGKSQGRDRWVQFDRSMRDAVLERVRTEADLRRALEHGHLEVHFQPEFMLDTHEIVGAEALVRWVHPNRGLLSAESFITLAEEAGLIVELGRWVLGEATMQAAAWVEAGHDLIVRVNLSARQLRPAVVGEVKQALAVAGLRPERLCLEVTETAIMDDVQDSARILQEFRDLGVLIAIDDFGTGFSSLSYLKRLPVDILKIDRTFVVGIGVDPDDTAIVRSIIGLARTLRLDVVAEGIENTTQLAELVRLGCARGQGFSLARPEPALAVSSRLGPGSA